MIYKLDDADSSCSLAIARRIEASNDKFFVFVVHSRGLTLSRDSTALNAKLAVVDESKRNDECLGKEN